MQTQNLLFEIGTEELPTHSLGLLINSLVSNLEAELAKNKLAYSAIKSFVTPRRLAVIIKDLINSQEDYEVKLYGPKVKVAFDQDNNPTKAALGFAKKCGAVEIAELEQAEVKGELTLAYSKVHKGKSTKELLPDIFSQAINKLLIKKPMRWGNHSYSFVRPVHWLLMLYGQDVVDFEIFGLKSSNLTYGHRFLAPKSIKIKNILDYNQALLDAFVIADYDDRKNKIKNQIIELANKEKAKITNLDELLDEVTCITEWPCALMGSFSQDFLEVPKECLQSAMQGHQKYFCLEDKNTDFIAKFITISNIPNKVDNSGISRIISGNERVLSARLDDARFFYSSDKKKDFTKLSDKLKKIVFQNKLGTVYDKTQRLAQIVKYIYDNIDQNFKEDINPNNLVLAATLAKNDLATEMVYEFPELQGIMGKYYAALDKNISNDVACALYDYYKPVSAGSNLPETKMGVILAIADRIDTIVGIYAGAGLTPTGDKDPYGLRRAALAIIKISIENKLNFDLSNLINFVINLYENNNISILPEFSQKIYYFIIDRLKTYYQENNIETSVFKSVYNIVNDSILDFNQKVYDVCKILENPEIKDLALINKRINNLLQKNKCSVLTIDNALLDSQYEKDLVKSLSEKEDLIDKYYKNKNYYKILELVLELKPKIDSYFDNVLILVEDKNVRNNRLVILDKIKNMIFKVADLSELYQQI
tara:strand:- start:5091 stop:7208 length:2118 start_codon:yes stop_codon:yes gene_type:complete